MKGTKAVTGLNGNENRRPPLFLTRTRYLNGLQCPKMLWLRVNRRENFPDPEIREQAVSMSRTARELAAARFPGAVAISHGEYSAMEEKTRALLSSGKGEQTLTHAALSFQNCYCLMDILRVREDGRTELYMVKSASHVSASSREDLAYQYYILRMAGFRVKKAAVLYINKDYRLPEKENVDPASFFREMDLTGEMKKKMSWIRDRIAALRIYCAQDRLPMRTLSEGCFSPYDCMCFQDCGKDLPKNHVFTLSSTPLSDKAQLYREGKRGFSDLVIPSDVPGQGLRTIPGLSDAAALQVLCELEKRPLQADLDAVREFLHNLWKPLYFLDFEAFQPAVPVYPGTKPFETIVFQYSLHFEKPDGTIGHREYLGEPQEDPRRGLSEALCADIPADACILVYNSSYEKKRISELAALYPAHAEHLKKMNEHIVDLMPVFKEKKIYDRRMRGSYSLKNVLPALFPDDDSLNYGSLSGVSQGQEAADAFPMLLRLSGAEKEALRSEMLRYCALDTFAMVKIIEKLRALSAPV